MAYALPLLIAAAAIIALLKEEEDDMFDCSDEMKRFHKEKVNLRTKQRDEMRDRRDKNRKRLKAGLEKNGSPKAIGQRTQGSYAMRTMVQDVDNDYDIDDGVYFQKEVLVGRNGGDMSALDARKMVRDALDDGSFKRAPEVRENCVRVFYDPGYHIDVPVYRLWAETNWLMEEEEKVELAGADWKDSDPQGVTRWYNDAVAENSDDDDPDQMRRITRLSKKFSRSRPSWKTNKGPSGFTISKLVQEMFVAKPGHDDLSQRRTMQAIKDRLDLHLDVDHPTVPGEQLATADDARTRRFRERLEENLSHLEILDDPNCTRADALHAWSKVFNDPFFSDLIEEEDEKADESDSSAAGIAAAVSAALLIEEAQAEEIQSAVDKQGGGKYA